MKLREQGLTIVHPFYDDQPRLEHHIRNWTRYSDAAKAALNLVLVDDGSKEPLIAWADFNKVAEDVKIPLHIYRVIQNLKWNTPGALNLGITQAPTEAVLIMDSDCLLQPEEMDKLMDFEPESEYFYYFMRNRISYNEHWLAAKKEQPLPCSILMTKTAFYTLGGFDEDFTGERSGGYGFFDSDFEHRAKKARRRAYMPKDIVIQEYMEDIVGLNVHSRENVRNKDKINKKIWYAKINGEIPRNTELCRFEWKKVFPV